VCVYVRVCVHETEQGGERNHGRRRKFNDPLRVSACVECVCV